MTRTSETGRFPTAGSRFMPLTEVAAELGYKSRGSVYGLIYSGELEAAAVGTGGRSLRVTRKSFEDYCARIEAEGAKRFKPAS